jgi:trans-aconitate methyltransferase
MNWNPHDYAKNSSAQLTWARELIARLDLTGSESVLDVGCGDGKITAEFARSLPNGFVLGVDSSADFIAYACEHYPQSEFTVLQFEQMDARCLKADRRFNFIFSNATLHWVDDHRAFLDSAATLLHPEGRLILSCGGEGNASAMVAALDTLISSPDWSPYFQGFEFPYFFYSPNDYSVWLPDAGFSAVQCALVSKDMTHDGPEGLAGWLRTTWFPYIQRLPEDLQARFTKDLVAIYLLNHPLDESGRTHVRMVRLEVEAIKL